MKHHVSAEARFAWLLPHAVLMGTAAGKAIFTAAGVYIRVSKFLPTQLAFYP